jgi:hypothetical protein
MPIVLNSGSPNVLDLSGPVKAWNGIALPLSFIFNVFFPKNVQFIRTLKKMVEPGRPQTTI